MKKYENKPAIHTQDYLRLIGVRDLPALTSAFDPGYDLLTVQSHLDQSARFMSTLKISMACWQIADETATRAKVAAARKHGVTTCTGGGPFEVAVYFGVLPQFLELCADIGVNRIEAGNGFTDCDLDPSEVIQAAAEFGLDVQFEVGEKHTGAFTGDVVDGLIDQGKSWLDAGAKQIVVEARESAAVVGLFDDQGEFNTEQADRFAAAFGLDVLLFEAPTKASQFAMLNHFGPGVCLGNIRLEELLRVEIYRRGLHSDAFGQDNLRPAGPGAE